MQQLNSIINKTNDVLEFSSAIYPPHILFDGDSVDIHSIYSNILTTDKNIDVINKTSGKKNTIEISLNNKSGIAFITSNSNIGLIPAINITMANIIFTSTYKVLSTNSSSIEFSKLSDAHLTDIITKYQQKVYNETVDETVYVLSVNTVKPVITKVNDILIGTTVTSTTQTPKVEGIAEVGTTVTIMKDTTVLGTVLVPTGGVWSITTSTLSQGLHNLQAKTTDAAGNISVLLDIPVTIEDAISITEKDIYVYRKYQNNTYINSLIVTFTTSSPITPPSNASFKPKMELFYNNTTKQVLTLTDIQAFVDSNGVIDTTGTKWKMEQSTFSISGLHRVGIDITVYDLNGNQMNINLLNIPTLLSPQQDNLYLSNNKIFNIEKNGYLEGIDLTGMDISYFDFGTANMISSKLFNITMNLDTNLTNVLLYNASSKEISYIGPGPTKLPPNIKLEGGLLLSTNTASVTGDPYINPINGKMYKLPEYAKSYRLLESKSNESVTINIETWMLPTTEFNNMISYIYDECRKRMNLRDNLDVEKWLKSKNMSMIDKACFLKTIYINVGDNNLMFDLESFDTVGDIPTKFEKIDSNVSHNECGVIGYNNEKFEKKTTYKIISDVYGIMYLELFKYENPQLRNALKIITTNPINACNSRGLHVGRQNTVNAEIPDIFCCESISDYEYGFDVNPLNEIFGATDEYSQYFDNF